MLNWTHIKTIIEFHSFLDSRMIIIQYNSCWKWENTQLQFSQLTAGRQLISTMLLRQQCDLSCYHDWINERPYCRRGLFSLITATMSRSVSAATSSMTSRSATTSLLFLSAQLVLFIADQFIRRRSPAFLLGVTLNHSNNHPRPRHHPDGIL